MLGGENPSFTEKGFLLPGGFREALKSRRRKPSKREQCRKKKKTPVPGDPTEDKGGRSGGRGRKKRASWKCGAGKEDRGHERGR